MQDRRRINDYQVTRNEFGFGFKLDDKGRVIAYLPATNLESSAAKMAGLKLWSWIVAINGVSVRCINPLPPACRHTPSHMILRDCNVATSYAPRTCAFR
eukprot:SAG11_NODE_5099_length_1665_cov_0.844189_3_plen_99_part_00